MPSTPVTNDSSGVPGRTSHERSKACVCPKLIQPASLAVCTAVMTRPAAMTTSTMPVMRKKRERLMRSPPL